MLILRKSLKIFGIKMKENVIQNNEALDPIRSLRGNGERILLVEDQEDICKVICKALTIYGYDVTTAFEGNQAIAACAHAKEEFHLLFSDVVLPGFDGIQLAHHLLSTKPGLKVLLTSGFTDQIHVIRERNYPFIQKPYSVEELLTAIRSLLDKTS
jgi:DNA-binding NtrC family response regulator